MGGRGFTIIELLMVIVVLSVIGAVIVAPAYVSVRGLGAGGVVAQGRLAMLAQGQAELFSRDLDHDAKGRWSSYMAGLAGSSPFPAQPSPMVDGIIFHVERSVECFEKDMATNDPDCSSGYARATVSVTGNDGARPFTLVFIKTRAGLQP